MNPGGSVKDRAARGIVATPSARGELQPGGTVVEGTAGNTGIGLAHVCNARGYRCVIVMPDNQSPEKYRLLRDARRRSAPGAGGAVQQSATSTSRSAQRLAGKPAGRHLGQPVRQHREPRRALSRRTGPEIWEQTGGTRRCLRGRERHRRHARRAWPAFLKSQRAAVRCVLADPPGSSLYALRAQRRAQGRPAPARSPRASASGASPPISKDAPIDDAVA